MAITGRFEADFESFYTAVNKAEAKLTDFQSGAGKVESSLNRMVDSFSGRRLIQEATLSAEAIERIGGTSKLTADELQKVAGEGFRRGRENESHGRRGASRHPARGERAEARRKRGRASSASRRSRWARSSSAPSRSKRFIEFALNVGKAEQTLSRLSAETQIGTDELQDLTAATSDYGLSNEELAKALFNVSKGISGGDDSVARGLHEIGLSLEDVKGKHGKELFIEIENGLAKLQGSLRDTAAADIFGTKLGASMAGFAREAEGAIEKAGAVQREAEPGGD
jgi:hypothetical protein